MARRARNHHLSLRPHLVRLALPSGRHTGFSVPCTETEDTDQREESEISAHSAVCHLRSVDPATDIDAQKCLLRIRPVPGTLQSDIYRLAERVAARAVARLIGTRLPSVLPHDVSRGRIARLDFASAWCPTNENQKGMCELRTLFQGMRHARCGQDDRYNHCRPGELHRVRRMCNDLP